MTGRRVVGSASVLVRVSIAMAVAVGAWPAVSSSADIKVSAGLRSCVKVGRWAPLRVTVTAAAKSAFVEAADPLGNSVRFPLRPAANAGGSPREFSGVFQIGRLDAVPRVTVLFADGSTESRKLRTDDGEAEITGPLRQSVVFIATLGKPAGFDALGQAEPDGTDKKPRSAKAAQRQQAERMRLLAYANPAELPSDVRGYDALQVMVVSGRYPLNATQDEALRRWVAEGGHLVVCRGSDLGAFIAEGGRRRSNRGGGVARSELKGDALLARWLPVTILGETRLRDLNGLELFSNRKSPIVFSGRVPSAKIADPQATGDGAGVVLASERSGRLSGPLIVRVPYGFGVVTFCGVDFDQPPIATWSDVGAVTAKILERTVDEIRSGEQSGRSRISQSGTSDLGTQLHAIQEDFPSVERMSSWQTIGLLVLYILMIGPIDYLLVHRLLKRPRLTWITFPLMVAIGTFLCVNNATALNGRELQLNQTDVVDIDATADGGGTSESSQSIRVQSWLTLYSPNTQRYTLRVTPANYVGGELSRQQSGSAAPSGLCWTGINETVYGGMYRAGGLGLGQLDYAVNPGELTAARLPVRLWSSRTLAAEWRASVGRLVESRLTVKDRRLTGWLRHHLPGPIENWVLVYGSEMYRFKAAGAQPADGAIPPDVAFPLGGERTERVSLMDELTGARFQLEKDGTVDENKMRTARRTQTAYEPAAKDVLRFFQTVSFHSAIGGRKYTALRNTSLERFDVSRLLQLNRAILIGRIRRPAVTAVVSTGGGSEREPSPTRSDTIVRIVLPVGSRHTENP